MTLWWQWFAAIVAGRVDLDGSGEAVYSRPPNAPLDWKKGCLIHNSDFSFLTVLTSRKPRSSYNGTDVLLRQTKRFEKKWIAEGR